MLNKLKLLLGLTDTSKDKLLTLLIQHCQDEARNYIHDSNLSGLENIVLEMAIYKFNRLGTEGVDGEDYSGVSFDYSTDYPSSIIRALNKHRKVTVIW